MAYEQDDVIIGDLPLMDPRRLAAGPSMARIMMLGPLQEAETDPLSTDPQTEDTTSSPAEL